MIQAVALTVTPIEENCYIAWDPDATGDQAQEAVIIDPGGEPQVILAELDRLNLKARLILNTHGHADHIGANAPLRAATGAPIAVHPDSAPMLASAKLCGATWLGLPHEEHQPDILIQPGPNAIAVPDHPTLRFDALSTPGHCPGHLMFHAPASQLLFAGDLVFRGSVGRTDLPGGDEAILLDSIRQHFLPLPEETKVLPGHGPATTVGRERKSNPYVAPLATATRS